MDDFYKMILTYVLLFTFISSCHGYRNPAGDTHYIDELLADGESNLNSIIDLYEVTGEKKRSIEDINNSNDDDLMSVQSMEVSSLNNKDNNKNNMLSKRDNIEYTYHEPISSNSLEMDDLMSVASPPLLTESNAQNEDISLITEDIMAPIANEQKSELTAIATESEISGKLREKRSKSNKKESTKKSKIVENDVKGDFTSIFSEIQSSKHHKLTRSDIRKLAKQAVMLASLRKLERTKNTSKKNTVNKPKKDKKNKNKKSEKEKKKTSSSTKHKSKASKEKSDVKISQNEFQMAETITNNDSSLLNDELIPTKNTEKTNDKKENNETPGVQTEDLKTTTTESKDGKEKKVEIAAVPKEQKSKDRSDENKNRSKGDALKTKSKDEKSSLSVSGNDMANNTDSIGDVIQNSKESSNKTSEFSEDLTAMSKKITDFDQLSDDALFSAITNNSTPVLNNSPTINDTSKQQSTITTPTSTSTSKSPTTEQTTTTKTTSKPTSPITSETNKTDNETNGFILGNDLSTEKEKKSSIAKPINIMAAEITHNPTEKTQLQNGTKKSDVPDNNAEIKDKISKLKDIISKTTPDKIPEQFLPDLPSGLRMIAWKQLLEKKKKQLTELTGAFISDPAKPVTININIDQPKTSSLNALLAKPSVSVQSGVETDTADITVDTKTGVKKAIISADKNNNTITDIAEKEDGKLKPENVNSKHVQYLQKHIKSARSLRKLIAKTLIGHCKSTGKRILEAFIAMDKALERAQTIAEVIGKKFHVDPDKIQSLVGDKEDEVVETFLRDIFTKL